MNDSIKRITLDFHDIRSNEFVNVKTTDTGRSIYISLVDGGLPYHMADDCSAKLRAKKPDGTVLYNLCTIDNCVIRYKVTSQTVAALGVVDCEITLIDEDGKQITSPSFTLIVDDKVVSDDEIESTDECSALYEATENANNAATTANKTAADLIARADAGDFDGPQGIQGPKGDPSVTFDDLTPEQKAELTGPKGDAGVYYGTTAPTDPSHPIWVNPEGDNTDYSQLAKEAALDALNQSLPTESGTWMPELINTELGDGTPAVQPTYEAVYRAASYKTIGDLVYVTCSCKFIITDAGSGYAALAGLPFLAKGNSSFSVEQVCGGISTEPSTAAFSKNGTGATLRVNSLQTFVLIRDASGIVARRWRVGYDAGGAHSNSVWIGFSGVYVKA